MWYSQLLPVTAASVANEWPSVLAALPSWRRESALAYRCDIDRYTCARSYLLLQELLQTHYGISEPVVYHYGPNGKPYLPSYPGVHFNYSHCRKAILCAVGDVPLGVDVEEIRFDADILPIVFSESERQDMLQAEDPAIPFTVGWTQKESLLKLTGTGLTDTLPTLLTPPSLSVTFHTDIHSDLGVVTTIATFG